MSEKITSTRRNVLKAIPAIGAGAVIPESACAALSPEELIDAAKQIIVEALSERYGFPMHLAEEFEFPMGHMKTSSVLVFQECGENTEPALTRPTCKGGRHG